MHIDRTIDLQRREFLRRSLILGAYGMAAPLVSTLGMVEAASAADGPADYKALVCVFLFGGNDYGNTIVPYDPLSYSAYSTIRQTLATPREQLAATALDPVVPLPNARTLALAPQLAPLKPIFDAGHLGIMLNIGNLVQPTTLAEYKARSVPLPPKLFSHANQQKEWQTGGSDKLPRGWGGGMADLMMNANSMPTFSCISIAGNAVFMSGHQAIQYQMSSNGPPEIRNLGTKIYTSSNVSSALRALITSPRSHWFEQNLNQITKRAIDAQAACAPALAAVPAFATAYDAGNGLARQLQMVARLIAARTSLGASRQVFFVSTGGFDLHSNFLTGHPRVLTTVANALASFYATTVELGVADKVTSFTASDFGRTLSSNGDGTDHGWGSHHFVMGGAVKGGRFYGQAPDVSVSGPDDVGQGRLLPALAVDQLAYTLGSWMGISDTNLANVVVPQIRNFSARNLGFMAA